ncbi:MAG TPA: hypothetical protein VMV05_04250 [bacterium]|nr:hypothetical protein [bacterium]
MENNLKSLRETPRTLNLEFKNFTGLSFAEMKTVSKMPGGKFHPMGWISILQNFKNVQKICHETPLKAKQNHPKSEKSKRFFDSFLTTDGKMTLGSAKTLEPVTGGFLIMNPCGNQRPSWCWPQAV